MFAVACFLVWYCASSLFVVVGGLGVSCLTTLRLLRVVCCCGCSDLALIFCFWFKFVCMCVSLGCLISAAALILFDQESPSPLTCLNNYVLLNRLRFSIFLAASANHHFMLRFASSAAKNLESLPSLRDDLPERLKRSARRQFGALSLLKVESTVCFQRRRRR